MIHRKPFVIIVVVLMAGLSSQVIAQEKAGDDLTLLLSNLDVHGFYEIRSGYRTQNDKYEKDMSIMEQRLQLDLSSYLDWADFKFKGDLFADLVTEQADFDIRKAYLLSSPFDFLDLKIGRQI